MTARSSESGAYHTTAYKNVTLIGPFSAAEQNVLVALFSEKEERRIFEKNPVDDSSFGGPYSAKLAAWKGDVCGTTLDGVIAKLLYVERYQRVPLGLDL